MAASSSTLGRAGERADRLLLAADVALAAGEVDIGRAQLAVHFARRDAQRHQPVRIERHADLAQHAAVAADAADAAQALELALDRVVDEPGELLDGHGGRRDRHRQDRLVLDVQGAR